MQEQTRFFERRGNGSTAEFCTGVSAPAAFSFSPNRRRERGFLPPDLPLIEGEYAPLPQF